ncbi:MYXO-CTERM domain-containing protein [Nannocystis exedens]|uniref:MYXO-CTERM domain-containing protein n=1 Tax=Nannocystis exedens TaxID=54 RepID=A0A1I1SZL6_9BACT|nr:MYXO-CTERM sorting domain-containing protein [Nannocystis exedens]PCC75696.1 hypothetical protein NAEX_08809 [Nannocystis exedens]SFD49393.1 MYXO-CTERM domain-containing protein [Nannocystis exedens]
MGPGAADGAAGAPPLRPLPLLVKGTGPKIYVLDDPLCIPGEEEPGCEASESSSGTDGPTSGAPTGEDGSASATSTTQDSAPDGALPPGFGAEDGCGCRHDGSPGAGLLVLARLAWRRRRRT